MYFSAVLRSHVSVEEIEMEKSKYQETLYKCPIAERYKKPSNSYYYTKMLCTKLNTTKQICMRSKLKSKTVELIKKWRIQDTKRYKIYEHIIRT